jgi:hypothetical protein
MNQQMTGGVVRALLATIAGAVLANGEQSLDTVIPQLLEGLAGGDTNAVVGVSVTLFAILWSMWTKLTGEKKEAVVNSLKLKKKE